MIRVLEEQQSYELLTTTTIGRVGFVHEGRVQILPVNFAVSGHDLLLRTAPDGVLGILTREPLEVAFEVDYHDPLGNTAWSVLMHGSLSRVPDDEAAGEAARVHPWAGEDRNLPLSFRIESITGRSVRRDQLRGKD
ncbi:pyridoxamine 5'-phosphate oxidase family protein [Microbacterium sp. NPDC090281]|jgi:nitroimidazol reductase NimA-like FMN-containing flavoprotein (pyridoxamine 5'-phosphate oxidase superfamily)|uniref:pyridoxamine 5'-phosphate oxidase family protein n=1 Tax=Microbacterium sp. NPDC090281 TaxID=3364208 RepID=UPI0038194C58